MTISYDDRLNDINQNIFHCEKTIQHHQKQIQTATDLLHVQVQQLNYYKGQASIIKELIADVEQQTETQEEAIAESTDIIGGPEQCQLDEQLDDIRRTSAGADNNTYSARR